MYSYRDALIDGTPLILDVDAVALNRDRGITINRRHNNEGYEVTILLRGQCLADVEDHHFVLRAGQAVIISPKRYHIFQSLPGELDRFTFRFLLPESPLSQRVKRLLENHRVFAVTPEIISLCHIAHSINVPEDMYWENELFTLLKALMLRILRLLSLGSDSSSARQILHVPSRMNQIRNYFEAHLSDEPKIEDLAREMGLSRRQLLRVLRETYGAGFRETLLSVRMDRAAWLLRTTGMSVGEIIGAVGYSSESAFYQAFRRYFHMTPLQYQRQFFCEDNL